MPYVSHVPTSLTCLRALRAHAPYVLRTFFFGVTYLLLFFVRALRTLRVFILYMPYMPAFFLRALRVFIYYVL